jgi:hypothetical protein
MRRAALMTKVGKAKKWPQRGEAGAEVAGRKRVPHIGTILT